MAQNNGIVYQNKDVLSKHFGEHLKEKSLEVYGFKGIPKIVDVMPTNLPAVEANELRIDNLFVFEDGTVGIVDYESEYKDENIVKYQGYLARIIKRWYDEYNELPQIRLLIIYTADVRPGQTKNPVDFGCFKLTIEEGFLTGLDGDEIYREIDEKIVNKKTLCEEDIMKLVIMPLTYPDRKKKQEAVSDAAQLAGAIEDDRARMMALAGILVFADKIISESDAESIRRRIAMTKIEAIIEREKEEALKKNTEQVTRDVTFNLIFDLVNSGSLAREEGMKRVGLSDDEFGKELEKYRREHATNQA